MCQLIVAKSLEVYIEHYRKCVKNTKLYRALEGLAFKNLCYSRYILIILSFAYKWFSHTDFTLWHYSNHWLFYKIKIRLQKHHFR